MSAYNVVSPAAMVQGQSEDISVVLANFDAIAAVINGNLDDTNIKAGAAIALTKLASAGQIGASGVTIGASSITLGGDTNLYRSSANVLKTDGGLWAVEQIVSRLGTSAQVSVGDIGGSTPGLIFGSLNDTNLYRSAANVLATDDTFQVNGLKLFGNSGVLLQFTGPDREYLSIGNSLGINTEPGKRGLGISNSSAHPALGPTSGGGLLYSVAGNLYWWSTSGVARLIASA